MTVIKRLAFIFSFALFLALSFQLTAMATSTYHQDLSISVPSSYCATCHQQQYQQWSKDTDGQGTWHYLSALDPMYLTMKTFVPPELLFFCEGCHESNTVWQMSDWPNAIPQAREVNIEEGTNCLACHLSNSSISTSSEIKQSEFCASCHNEASGAVSTYTEWLVDYGAKKSCQTCHMPKGNHTWPGAHNFALLKNSVAVDLKVSSQPTVKSIIKLRPQNVGHSVPSSVVRKLILEVKLLNAEGSLISQQSYEFYKRFGLFGEDVSANNDLKANQTTVVLADFGAQPPGSYTVKVVLKHQMNRFFAPFGEQVLKRQAQSITVD